MKGKIYPVRQSFNSGEVSELVEFRDDVQKYNSSCLILENTVPLVEGGAKKMPGTYFAGTTANGGAMFQAAIFGTVMNVSEMKYGVIKVGEVVFGPGVIPTVVTAYITGTGGTGGYTIDHSQTVAPEIMQTQSSGKSRLVPFQFSNVQGAILEFSAGIVRVWEGASQGSWSLGIALQVPNENNYDPSVPYAITDVVLTGPTFASCFEPSAGVVDLTKGVLYITAPYGTTNAAGVFAGVSTNSIDTMLVEVADVSPNQKFQIILANATRTKNAANLIQLAVRALGSLNPGTGNFVDLSQWTITPDPVYLATPWLLGPGGGVFDNNSWISQCLNINQFDQFPRTVTANGLIHWNDPFWEQFNASNQPPLEVATPYAEEDLFDLDCSTQSADVLWIFHTKYPPAVIERLSANLWKYSLSLPGQQPGEAPYRGTLGQVKTGYNALGQSITAITKANPCVVSVAATGTSFPNGSRIYINEVAGMLELNQGEFLVSGGTLSGGIFSFSLIDPNTNNPVDSTGYIAYISGGFAVQVVPLFLNTGDFPSCGTLYQERLFVGGSINNPTQINGSVQDDYPNFIADPNAADFAVQFTLVSNKLDQILNMIGTPNSLVIGTSGGVWTMSGSNGLSLSETNVTAQKQTSMGVSFLQPQLVGSSAIFISRSLRIVTFLVFNFVSNQWDTYDLTRLNRVITLGPTEQTSGIAQTAFQIEPYPILWAVRNDGQLLGLVFNTQDQVYAWFRINMLPGIIESAAVITGDGQEDQLVVVVNRLTNGVTQRYVEYFMPQEIFSQLSNAFFVNSGQQLKLLPPTPIQAINNGTPCVVYSPVHRLSTGMQVNISGVQGMVEINQDATQAYTITVNNVNQFTLNGMDTTSFGVYTGGGTVTQVKNNVTGLSYLIGQNVVAVGDGALILPPGGVTVTGDSITFPYYANQITIGIPYTVTIRPTNPVITSQGSTTRGFQQKLDSIAISLYQSMGGYYGVDPQHMYPITYGPGSLSLPPGMSTFDSITRDMDSDWSTSSTIYITQSDPFPFTLRGLVASISVNPD